MRRLLFALVVCAACSGGGTPTPTGSTCPPASTLTYDNFGRAFMETYCTRCHASALHGADRHGAPLFHDFDTLIGILNVRGHVDEEAAAGPDAVNELMPGDDGARPTREERFQLGEWIACESANLGQPDAAPLDASPVDAAAVDAP